MDWSSLGMGMELPAVLSELLLNAVVTDLLQMIMITRMVHWVVIYRCRHMQDISYDYYRQLRWNLRIRKGLI